MSLRATIPGSRATGGGRRGDSGFAPYQVAARRLLRETLFRAARAELEQRTWSEITMADVARTAGVSRHTLYRTFRTRSEFAQAFVIHEGERFFDVVEEAVRRHFDDPHVAVAAGLEAFLESARGDKMVGLVLSDDGTGGVLPLLTTQGMPVVRWATARLAQVIAEGWPAAPGEDVALLAETLVRLAISHLIAPDTAPPGIAAGNSRLLGPFIDRVLTGAPGEVAP
ncbi:MAG: TetR family transcriptional regulator [Acidobacteriota bacterium]|nr:TetR family transcriptional regulator [Acidobacteriota bacterium]